MSNYRSKKLRDSARDERCVNCRVQDGTVVWAHSNESIHGKGLGLKAHDLLGLYLCHACHSYYDSCKRVEAIEFFLFNYHKTMVRVAEKLRDGELVLD